MRILFLESSQIWMNNLPRGFQVNGHNVLISGPLKKETLPKILDEFQPDFAISIGWGMEQTKEKQDLIKEQMKRTRIPLIYWAVEDPAYTEVWSIPLVKRMQPDFVFTICPQTIETYKKLGVPSAHLDFGFEETIHCPVQQYSNYRSKIAVVANAYPHILEQYPNHFRRQAINVLIRPLIERNIRIDFWGKDWEKMNSFFGFDIPHEWIHGHLPYTEANKVYNSSDIMIGLQNYPNLLTQRTYEILGSGGFLITMNTPGVRSLFQPGKELITSSSPEETVQLINYYLKHSEKRKFIQEQGNAAVQIHSYQVRAKHIIDTLIEQGIVRKETEKMERGEIIFFHDIDEKIYETYVIKKGDTLYKISQKFGVAIKELKHLNELSSDMIVENEILKIREKF
ncbi:peptigoglycan-binding protein LysM [Bacillus cereus]|nr:peptigoglycan-binding protein LysM [Bacillus cereus]